MNALEEFLMIKFQAELGYCQRAMLKVGMDIAKEVGGLAKDYNDAIRKYEAQLSADNTMTLNWNKCLSLSYISIDLKNLNHSLSAR